MMAAGPAAAAHSPELPVRTPAAHGWEGRAA